MALDNLIDSVSLYVPRHIAFHGAIFPFVVLYFLWSYICFSLNDIGDIYFIGIFAVAIAQVLCSLCCYWSVSFRCLLSCRRVTSPKTASLVKVIPIPNNGFTELVVLKRFKDQDLQTVTWFRYHEIKYLWNDDKKCFHSLQFPISNTIEQYINCKGYTSDEQLAKSIRLYGLNELYIQLPKFNDLFIEKATAPFFVFQVFCITLWCFDKYWYYSIFTLAMLVLFEFTLVKQQLRNMDEIRKMGNNSIDLFVYRNKKWQLILSDDLTPGDIVSITRGHDDQTVPCDLLLLRGSCIVDESLLTGESIPQMKEPIENISDYSRNLDFETDKKLHILFSGTRVVQHTSPIKSTSSIRASPDNGCIAFVLRTGFNTSQGNLLQTILFGVKHVTANNLETLAFILFLLIFAIAAATYLWIKGTEDPNRSRYKLFLECSLILTSVIPPELPVELSLAVNSSILSLSKVGIYCTEAFRIPFAGKVEICCFDKTGTLTKDDLIVEGIAGINNEMMPMVLAPEHTIQVLASCHSLVQLDDTLVGDPIEKASLDAINWLLCKNDLIVSKNSKMPPLKIMSRFYFSSSLKRMSVLASYKCPKTQNKVVYIASVKGAPEVLKSMLKSIPSNYDCTYQELAGRGARVLALARKEMKFDPDDVKNLKRETLECDLDFVGFVVVSCPLKPDSKNVIKELQESSHMVTMITGDNPLTACYVANELNFTRSQSSIILTLTEVSNMWYWVNDRNKVQFPLIENIKKLVESYDLCLTGDSLAYLNKNHKDVLKKILPHVCVFARVAPKEKEFIIIMLKALGYCTLMCGDGTNDVGALKHAHVGIAILARSFEKLKPKKSSLSKIRKSGENVSDQMKRLMKEMDEESVTVVKSGDASIAAPFTSKYSSVACVCHVIKQGRCTLVTTLQMFKILALNAIIAAYSQSVLYVKGIKFSDSQATLQGLLLAVSFLFISRSNPLKILSKQRPLPNIFNIYTILTVMFQFIIHFFSLVFLVQKAGTYVELKSENTTTFTETFNETITNSSLILNDSLSTVTSSPEQDIVEEFTPNIVNSAVFIISMALQISTFSVNYRGRPFMENLSENKPLLYSTIIQILVILCLSMGTIDVLNVQFEIIQFPYEFRLVLLSVLVLDCFGSFAVDRICLWLFGEGKLKKIPI
ncbi:P-type ATPase, transmembrane domain,P-type ATPase, phosphorylation site,P-type ATPase, cytoplasmic [Cinara cedri]|uniref:P-type ATPase, transmembrane domain,P-type ATPase, phosphorylation site,P-type ATPase, cytoplasmic n=1 Tax=Cinara cedri TaxID=506608 RepID=A0A5E4MHF1_9HEMI|nr:P-type ATPase, transmembrane domain,P-type ATPase, phosphorylation site,P-type ATPase, cytoplasmic [Cinara cedri]